MKNNPAKIFKQAFSGRGPRGKCLRMVSLFALCILPAIAAQAQSFPPEKSATTKPPEFEATTLSDHGNGVQHGRRVSQWFDLTPKLSGASGAPRAAEDCAMLYDPRSRRVILFGGKDDKDNDVDEIWGLDLARHAWEKIHAKNAGPPASEDHSVIYDPIGHRMIVFGGENGLTWNNTWSFDFTTLRWRDMTDSTAPAREDHSAIYDSRGKRMVIFGGRYNNGELDFINIHEVWALDLDPHSPSFEKWQNLTVEDRHPLGRSDHAVVYDSLKNRMVIYGGWDKKEKEYLKDTWAFYFSDSAGAPGKWKEIKAKYSHPPKRRHVTGVYDASRNWFIVFGGFGDEGYLNDVWALNLATDIWINITPGPQPRLDHQVVYDPDSKRLLLYGGDARLEHKFHDVWELQIEPELPVHLLEEAATTKVQKSGKKKK